MTPKEILQRKIFTPDECHHIMAMKQQVRQYLLNSSSMEKGLLDPSIHLKDIIVAGGCYYSTLHNTAPNDIDVFVLNRTRQLSPDVLPLIRNPYKDIKTGAYLNNPNVVESFIVFEEPHPKMNYIITMYKTREEMIAEFDYLHCCVSYNLDSGVVFISRDVYNAICNKKLIINNKKHLQPYRRDKFLDKGFKE